MNQSQYNQLFSFIWNIATDVLVYAFEKGDYKKIILPMMVLRRIDVLLEPTKQQLLTQKELLDKNNIQNQDPILYRDCRLILPIAIALRSVQLFVALCDQFLLFFAG